MAKRRDETRDRRICRRKVRGYINELENRRGQGRVGMRTTQIEEKAQETVQCGMVGFPLPNLVG